MRDALNEVLEELANAIAHRVVAKLQAGDLHGFVDQSSSPLGRRRHINAIRSGALPGKQVGRRYLARQEDVNAFLAKSPQEPEDPELDDADSLAAELGFSEGKRAPAQ